MYIDVGIYRYNMFNNVHDVIVNHLLYNASTGSIEYVTHKEYDYKCINSIINPNTGEVSINDDDLAKLMLFADGFELFRNEILSVNIAYNLDLALGEGSHNAWFLVFRTLCNSVRFDNDWLGYNRHILVNWFSALVTLCYMQVPDIYVYYLLKDKNARVREIKKILGATKFEWVDTKGCIHSSIGIDSIKV